LTELIPIKQIKQSSSLQPRAKMDTGKIDEYTESMRRGDAFPAVVVYRVGGDLFLVDGYHRFMAAQGAKLDRILAEVRAGTMREAILQSAGVNSTHGIPRSNEDKRRAVMILLRDKEWGLWNDTKIAETCHVSPELVGKIRKSILPKSVRCTSEKKKVERAGKVFKMDTSKIGRKERPAEEFPEYVPPAPVTVPLKGDPTGASDPVRLGDEIRKQEMAAAGQNQPAPNSSEISNSSPFRTAAEVLAHDQNPLDVADPPADIPDPLPPDAPIAEQLKRDNQMLAQIGTPKPLVERGPVKVIPVQLTKEQAAAKITEIVRGYFTPSAKRAWEDIRKTGEFGDTDLEILEGMRDAVYEKMGGA